MLCLCPVRCQTHSVTIMWENLSHFSFLNKNTRIWSRGGWKQKPFLELCSGIFDMNQTHSWWAETCVLWKYNYHHYIKQLTCTFNGSHRHNMATRCLTLQDHGLIQWLIFILYILAGILLTWPHLWGSERWTKIYQLYKWEISKYNLGWYFSNQGFVSLCIYKEVMNYVALGKISSRIIPT